MIALFMLFPLSTTHKTVGALRSYIVDRSVAKYREVDGLRMKVFLSNQDEDTFGALYLWESEEALAAALPQLGASVQDRWGIVPTMQRFEVEAIVEGRHATPDLARVGRALE